MLVRLFQSHPNRQLALQRLGAATVLQWSNFTPAMQDALVQQAMAMSDDANEVHAEIARLTKTPAAKAPQ